MATPRFVPSASAVLPPRRTDFGGIPPARRSPLRPGAGRRPPRSPGFGLPCPDAGYALLLAHLTDEYVVLELVERRQDAYWAIAILAMRRAGALGRAPLIEDLEIARSALAYDGGGPADFTRWRARRLSGIAHDPNLRQNLVDVVMLAGELPPSADLDAVGGWRATLRRHMEADHAIT
jgi:hypothetical protein